MGNHYDPHHDAMVEREERERELGQRMKDYLATLDARQVYGQVGLISRCISGAQDHVLGKSAVMRLDEAQERINRLFHPKT